MVDPGELDAEVTLVGAALAVWGTGAGWVRRDGGTLGEVVPYAEVAGVSFPAFDASGFALPWSLALLPPIAAVVAVGLGVRPRRRAVAGGTAALALVAGVAVGFANARFGYGSEHVLAFGGYVTLAGAFLLLLGAAMTADAGDLAPTGRDRFGNSLDGE